MSSLKNISVSQIIVPETKLRDMEIKENTKTGEVNIAWINFVASIRDKGILNPISVIENADTTYTLIDGLRRFSACKEIDSEYSIPCHIIDDTVTENDILARQVVANAHTFKTRKGDYARVLRKWISEGRTYSEIRKETNLTNQQIDNILSLNSLPSEVLEALNNNDITMKNALVLVKAKGLSEEQFNKLFSVAKISNVETLETEYEEMKTANRLLKNDITVLESAEYFHKAKYSQARFNEIVERVNQYKESASLGDSLTERQRVVIEIIDYILCSSVQDMEQGRKDWEEKQTEAIAKAKEKAEKADKKAPKN